MKRKQNINIYSMRLSDFDTVFKYVSKRVVQKPYNAIDDYTEFDEAKSKLQELKDRAISEHIKEPKLSILKNLLSWIKKKF